MKLSCLRECPLNPCVCIQVCYLILSDNVCWEWESVDQFRNISNAFSTLSSCPLHRCSHTIIFDKDIKNNRFVACMLPALLTYYIVQRIGKVKGSWYSQRFSQLAILLLVLLWKGERPCIIAMRARDHQRMSH